MICQTSPGFRKMPGMLSQYMRNVLFCLLLVFPTIMMNACSSGELGESNSAETAFKAAEEYDNDERYEEALIKYSEVKNKHPYSKFAVEAELKIADVHYKREAFLEAQTAYQLFKDFHPKHPRIDYVTYRLAMSYYGQLPSTADRDLSPAYKAIQFFDEVINVYPSSKYVGEARDTKDKALRLLAEKETYIANFYYKRDMYDSALKRYEGLLERYPNRGYDEEALYKAGMSAYELGNKDLGTKYIRQLLDKFPSGDYSGSGRRALEKYGSR